jgi:hypothetical protein
MVSHVYNPSYSGGKDWEDYSLRPCWARLPTPISINKLGVVAHTCHSSYQEAYLGGQQFRPAKTKLQDHIQKITKAKKTAGVQVVEHLSN